MQVTVLVAPWKRPLLRGQIVEIVVIVVIVVVIVVVLVVVLVVIILVVVPWKGLTMVI